MPDCRSCRLAAPFKAGGLPGPANYTEIKAGPITLRDIADLYIYPNTLRAVRVSGAQVKEWLERSAALFNRIDPENTAIQPLIDPKLPSYDFDVISGVTYAIDITRPARYDGAGQFIDATAERIVDLCHDGKPIDPAQVFHRRDEQLPRRRRRAFPRARRQHHRARGAGYQSRGHPALYRRAQDDRPGHRADLAFRNACTQGHGQLRQRAKCCNTIVER
ncbi:MAG: 5'-nucleotidase C-terminal domain-containing protein [Aliidongia sp.]